MDIHHARCRVGLSASTLLASGDALPIADRDAKAVGEEDDRQAHRARFVFDTAATPWTLTPFYVPALLGKYSTAFYIDQHLGMLFARPA